MYGGTSGENLFKAPVLPAFFFMPAAISVSMNTGIGASMFGYMTLAGQFNEQRTLSATAPAKFADAVDAVWRTGH